MFTPDPFDIAPAAHRPTRAMWLLLSSTLLFVVASAILLERSLDAVHRAQDATAVQQEAERARVRSNAAARALTEDPATLERLRAQREVQGALRMSWSGLFDALERAGAKVDGRVTLTSLAPIKAKPDGAEVGIVGLAYSTDALLDYLDALQSGKQVKEAVLVSQQLAQGSGGANVTRFHISLVWLPKGEAR